MSITINIRYTGKDGAARSFADDMEVSGTAERIRQEDGNLRYEYFLPMSGCGSVLLIDEWRDHDALDAHHASPMMQKIAELREKYDLSMSVEYYIRDDGGISDSDRKFIKSRHRLT